MVGWLPAIARAGLIFGRNVWQRQHDESLRFASLLRDILATHPSGTLPRAVQPALVGPFETATAGG